MIISVLIIWQNLVNTSLSMVICVLVGAMVFYFLFQAEFLLKISCWDKLLGRTKLCSTDKTFTLGSVHLAKTTNF